MHILCGASALLPSFHRTGSGLRLDPAAQSGTLRPRGGSPAASQGQGAGGRAEDRWPGASAVGDRLVNFVRSQRVSVVTFHIQRKKPALPSLPSQCVCVGPRQHPAARCSARGQRRGGGAAARGQCTGGCAKQ